jgi:ABC-type Co2+ transport system permease subunit
LIFNHYLQQNDIALMALSSPITTVTPVQLPYFSDVGNTFEGLPTVIAGWGTTSSGSYIFHILSQNFIKTNER